MNFETLLRERMREGSVEQAVDASEVRGRARWLRRRRRAGAAAVVVVCAVGVSTYAVVGTRPGHPVPPAGPPSPGAEAWGSAPSGFLSASRSVDGRTLYLQVPESTRDQSSLCWSYYTASLSQLPDGTPSVTLTAWDRPGAERASCGAVGVGPFYVTVHLGRALSRNRVYDAAVDRMRQVAGVVNPTPDENAAITHAAPPSLFREAGTPRPHD